MIGSPRIIGVLLFEFTGRGMARYFLDSEGESLSESVSVENSDFDLYPFVRGRVGVISLTVEDPEPDAFSLIFSLLVPF